MLPTPDPSVPSGPHTRTDFSQIAERRSLFWEHVVREILTGLSIIGAKQQKLFDGRMGVLTYGGERIPIGAVVPMFACSTIKGGAQTRTEAIAVECTVFRVRTPAGEIYTLPLKEIRGIHAMTPELMDQIEKESMTRLADRDSIDDPAPFGLAAFTTAYAEDEEEPESAEPTDPSGDDEVPEA